MEQKEQEPKKYEEMSESEKVKEDWMNAKWRPMMGWMYMAVCVCDFILFPIFWSILHASLHTGNITQWSPLTLQGAGLFHIAMGAILGIAVYGRTQEKLVGVSNDNSGTSTIPVRPPITSPVTSVPTIPVSSPIRPPVVPPAI